MDGLLAHVFVYLAAAVVAVPVAKRLGLGSVLGYLLAGVAIGPFVLGLVGSEGHHVMHVAEFGVVMMLFLVGLELEPALLWQMRRSVLGLGGSQVGVTAVVVAALALVLGLSWQVAVAVGFIVAMSSTAIVLQSLEEKSLLNSSGGRACFSVLLFQDIAVIPILALFPLLGSSEPAAAGEAARSGWVEAALVVAAVVGVVAAGRYLVRPVYRFLASTRLREIFTAASLLLVVGIALLMLEVGLSPALGTFLAGVVLADSEYRHEIEADIEPFKGLLLGLFFVSVGAQIDFGFIAARPALVGGLVAGVIALKLAVLYAIARAGGLDRPARWLFGFGLAQVGEFAFVLVAFGQQTRVFSADIAGPLMAVVALSMAATPLGFIALERLILPRTARDSGARRADDIAPDGHVVIAGFGRVGQVVGRLLRANGISATVLDLDPDMIGLLRRLGLKVHYGDASRLDLLHAARTAEARLFVLAIDDTEQAVRVAETVRAQFPGLPIVARARNRVAYYSLRKAGVDRVYRETFTSALEMGTEALRVLGMSDDAAQRRARAWRGHEERALEALCHVWGADEATYWAEARRMLEETERLMREECDTLADDDGERAE